MLQSNTLLAYVLSWSVAMAASMTCEIARNNLIQNGHFHSGMRRDGSRSMLFLRNAY